MENQDILLLSERVRLNLSLKESHYREFKTALEGKPNEKKPRKVSLICKEITEALVGFANADGGAIIIGVEDDGTITGIPHNEKEIKEMLKAATPEADHILKGQKLPMSYASKLVIDEHVILFFEVKKGTGQIYQLSDGRCMKREDDQTVPVSVDVLKFEQQEIQSRKYCNQFVDNWSVSDLDTQLLMATANQYSKNLSIERYLQLMGLGEYEFAGLRLRWSAVFLFGKNVSSLYGRSEIRFISVSGTEVGEGVNFKVKSEDTIKGNIFELIVKSWEYLRSHLAYTTQFGANAQFEQKYIYPENAVQEAVLNAIAHRDYVSTNPIEVFIFTNRIEIKSPGALLSTIKIANLYNLEGAHESRNPLITRVLRENKYMRELGEGMRRIFTLMQENELEKPELYSNGLWFRVTLFNKNLYSEKELVWISHFKQFDLTANQKKIVVLGMNEKQLSTNDIMKALNTADVELFRVEVTKLRTSKIMEELVTNEQAGKQAKKQNKEKRDIPRFRINIPQ